MEPGIEMLAVHGALDVRPVHWDDDDRAFFTRSSIAVLGGDQAAHVRQEEQHGRARRRNCRWADEEQGKSE